MLSNIAAERALLAGILQNGQEAYLDSVDILRPEIFTDTKNSMIYLTLKELLDKGKVDIDKPSLYACATALSYSSHICEKPEDKDYINALFNYSISCANTRDQAAILYKLFVARSLQECSQKTYKQLSEVKGVEGLDSIISIPEKNLTSAINTLSYEDDLDVIGNYVDDYLDYVDNNKGKNVGIPTPFPIFNSVIGLGMRPGLTCIGGRLKSGKSSVGKEVALHTAKINIPTLIIDTELSWKEQLIRMISSESKVPMRYIEQGYYKDDPSAYKKVKIAAEIIKKLPLTHKNVSGKDFADIIGVMKRWLHKTVGINNDGKANPCCIIYDYLKLMDSSVLKNMREYEAFGYQTSYLHDFCQMYELPIMTFVQLNREGINDESTASFGGSDRIGHNAISLSIFKRKTPEEIAQDGHQNGNAKIVPVDGRFMEKLDFGDYINFNFDGATNSLTELGTKYNIKNKEFEVQE